MGNMVSSTSSAEYKLVLLVRMDLGMGKGKIASQLCHATLDAYKLSSTKRKGDILERWERCGQPKVTLKVKDEQEMLHLIKIASSKGVTCTYIVDAGRTQIPGGTKTVAALGPAPNGILDSITGGLKLY